MVATTTKSKKAKSRALQNKVSEDIRAKIAMDETDVAPSIMGTSGIDIRLSFRARKRFPFGVECKNQEKISVWSAIKQCEGNAHGEGLIPLLIIKRNHTEPYAVINWNEFMRLLPTWKKLGKCQY